MADVPEKKEAHAPLEPAAASAPPPDIASDPEEDDLSDLDGRFARGPLFVQF